jgi:integrase
VGVYKRGDTWWYEFVYAGKRIRESAKTTRKNIAIEAEKRRRLELERAMAGLPSQVHSKAIRSVKDSVQMYLEHYPADHTPKATVWATGCLSHVHQHMGGVLVSDLTENSIRSYITTRKKEGASNRTINMEVAELSRALGRTWRELWPKVNKLRERSDVGVALSREDESRLIACADALKRSPLMRVLIRLALSTGMRSGELISLTWSQVDFWQKLITVGSAKTNAGTGRVIPMNSEVMGVLTKHREWYINLFGEPTPAHYVFPFGSPLPKDPTRPTVEIKTAWKSIRKAAKVNCRWHDLRHTAATKMAEAGVPESTMLALMGHMSRKMLERYSHIRMQAKRDAVESLVSIQHAQEIANGVPTNIPTHGEKPLLQ